MKSVYAQFVLLFCFCPCLGQVLFAEKDIDSTIAFYKTTTVASFRDKMPPSSGDASFKRAVRASLPRLKTEIRDARLLDAVRTLLSPVLLLYDRLEVYDIVVVDDAVPFTMLDSGVVLVISTGLIRQVENDDQFLGYIAHEVGHEYFTSYSNHSKYLLQLTLQRDNEPVFRKFVIGTIALVEIQCDSFASLSLCSLGYNPLEFVRSLEKSAAQFPKQVIPNYPPPVFQRKRVIEGLCSG